ncbi:rhomboid family intramembrane serine protease [Haliangium sp.]|uniref:rhomboid family intramembrane serine protease n=1 Tax=Haliangium sp. TaxID=2663208 RepID=UPI003D0B58F7
MFLPIGDEPNARAVPWVNYALMGANVAVFVVLSVPLMARAPDPADPLVQEYLRELAHRYPQLDPRALLAAVRELSAYDVFLHRWGYRAAEPSLLTLFTAMFLHGGWLHVTGNMLFLWIYGDNVEHRMGHAGYLVAYLACGVVATLAYAAFLPASSAGVPLVGASGAISGVLGFYFLWFPKNRVRVLVLLFPIYVDVWKVSARLVLGAYVVIDNVLPLLLTQGAGGVAHGAHLGGFAAGLGTAFGLDRWRRWRARGGEHPEAGAHELPTGPDQVAALVGTHPAAALAGYRALTPAQRRALAAEVPLELADWLRARGYVDAALGLYYQVLDEHGRGLDRDQLGRTLLGLGLVLLERGEPAAAYQALARVVQVGANPELVARADAALARIAAQQRFRIRPRRWGR